MHDSRHNIRSEINEMGLSERLKANSNDNQEKAFTNDS